MKSIWIIAKRELTAFFDSLIAYILLIAFLGISGFITWFYQANVFYYEQATLGPFFQFAYWILFLFTPALTMKMIAEENKTGTIELLLTKAVSDWQVILGKYLACMMLVGIALIASLPYYFTISSLGEIDHGAVWCGYLALFLISSAYVSIGMFSSSVTNNQIVAFLLTLFISVFFIFIFSSVGDILGKPFQSFFYYLDFPNHFSSMIRGVIDSRDVLFFVSVSFFALLLAESQLGKRNVSH